MNYSKPSLNIIFELVDKDENDILQVDMSACGKGVKTVNLNDNEQCQTDLKDVFLALIETMVDFELTISFKEDKAYPRELIHSAMEAYVDDLSKEIQVIATELETELSEISDNAAGEKDVIPNLIDVSMA